MASGKPSAPDSPFVYTGREEAPKDVARVEVATHVTEIPEEAFAFCDELTEVTLPEGLIRIGRRAFVFCRSLRRVRLPPTVVEVGDSAFGSCSSLEDASLNEGLARILDGAFGSCAFERIALPSTVTAVGDRAFVNCQRLREAALPAGMRSYPETVGSDLFYNCHSLEKVSLSHSLLQNMEHGRLAGFYRDTSLDALAFPQLSERLRAMSAVGRGAVEAKIAETEGVELNDEGEIVISGFRAVQGVIPGAMHWLAARRAGLKEICELMAHHELRDATTIVVLAFWKASVDGADEEGGPAGRDARRTEVPGPARDAILLYLGNAVFND